MLVKLSLRNARRQMKDYLIYFTTIIIAATLMYAFNALVFSDEIRQLSELLNTLPLMIGIASAAVVGIMGWLVYYMMRFMMLRRTREFGIYILLGMERGQILRLFFWENAVIGMTAVMLGLISGNLLFQLLRAMLLAIYEIKYSFNFQFSLASALLAIIYFVGIFVVGLLLNLRKIKISRIAALIHLDKINERELAARNNTRKYLFITAIICGSLGIVLLITYDALLSMIGAALIVFFLFAFYISFSSGMTAFYDKRPGKKYKGNTLFVYRSLASKVGSMSVTMSILSILLTATLISIGTGMAFHHLFSRNAKLETGHNLFISTYMVERGFDPYKTYIHENIDVTAEYEYAVYRMDTDQVTDYITPYRDGFRPFESDLVMAYSDYAALRSMLDYDEVLLQDGTYLLHGLDYLEELLSDYNEIIELNGIRLQKGETRSETFTQQLWDGNGGGFILIVKDEIAKSLAVSHIAYAAKTGTPPNYVSDMSALNDIRTTLYTRGNKNSYDMIYSKDITKEQNASVYVMIVLPLFYVALVLLIVSATILAVQMLSELAVWHRQYGILYKLGAERSELIRALRKQFSVYYLLPTFPAIIISAIFIFFLCAAFDPGVMQSTWQIWGITGATIGMFLVVFLVYIVVSYKTVKQFVIPD